MWFRPRQPDLQGVQSIQRGRGREPEYDFHRISTPVSTIPASTEANGYESDVLSFTSLLDSPHSTSDLDFTAQNELLRQEVRKMQQDNLAREKLRLELDENEGEHGNGQDLSDGDAPSRASTRGRLTSDDQIDVNLLLADLQVSMNDRGRAHAATGRVELSGLSFTQLAEIADQAQLPCPGDTEDFAHVAEDPFTVPLAHAYVTTTHDHHGILEKTNQAIEIPNNYDEAMSSPQREEWQGACSNEMHNLRKHNVYNLVPLSSVPKVLERNPAQLNMPAAKHVLRYLRGNPVVPIVHRRGQFRLAAFTDSSIGANPDNGRSTTGYLFFLAGGLISYGAITQTLTAQSTVEAKTQALSYSAREAVHISHFMTELNFKTFESVPINSDSTGALTVVAGNAMHSQRTKHMALRYFFIRELVLRGQVTLHRPSEHQLADIATKHLPKHRFAPIIQQIKDFSC
ncbi:unnamed protein product [Ectocarpus sp. CCAP 1310/34]|nr:unnamed protein product [Ectocarpus sp. CCAP 1310/34]